MFVLLVDGVIGQVHVFVVFVELCCVCLRCESRQAFFVDIDPQRLVASDDYIYPQVEFVAVNQKRICNVSGYDAEFVDVQIIDIIDYMNSSASAGVTWLHDPNISPWVRLLELMIMIEQVSIFIWQNVCIWNKIENISSKFLLHLDKIEAHSVLTCDLIWLWKMIDSLIFIQAFIKICFTAATCPKYVPFVWLRIFEVIRLAKTTD